MALKQVTIYDSGDHLNITEHAMPGKLQEKVYITQDQWFEVLNIDREYVQDTILGILQDKNHDYNSKEYQEYKDNIRKVLCSELCESGAKMIKETYLNSKDNCMRTRVILELMDEIINHK